MKKRVSLIALIFQAVVAVSLFLPWIFSEVYWSNGGNIWAGMTRQHATSINFFGGLASSGGILSYLTLAVMIFSVMIFAFICSEKFSSLTKYGVFAPVIAFLLCVIVTYIRCSSRSNANEESFWSIEIGWLLYISLALQIVTAILAVLIGLNKFSDEKKIS